MCQEEMDAKYVAGRDDAGDAGAARVEGDLFAAAWRGGDGRGPGARRRDGFKDVELFGPHAKPDGDFPNVPGHVANPENPAVFDSIIAHASHIGRRPYRRDRSRIATASAARRRSPSAPGATWHTLTGNQIGALLADYVLETSQGRGTLSPQHFIVETLVTTQLMRRIGDSYGVRTIGDLLVGFKWIAGDRRGRARLFRLRHRRVARLHGRHAYARQGRRRGVAAAVRAGRQAEGRRANGARKARRAVLAARRACRADGLGADAGQRGHDADERSDGPVSRRARREARRQPRGAACAITSTSKTWVPGGDKQPLAGPKGDLVILDLALEGNYVAIRPSGTEPKIKFYMFTYEPPEQLANLEDAKAELDERLTRMEADMRTFAGVLTKHRDSRTQDVLDVSSAALYGE